MLTKNSLFILLILSLCSLGSCDLFGDEDPKPDPENPADALPPATQTGENTFGCLVNGIAWIPKGCLGSASGADLFFPNLFTLSGQWECPNENMSLIILTDKEIVKEQQYYIKPRPKEPGYEPQGGAGFNNSSCIYEFDYVLDGSITLSKLDKTNKIASGTFEFTTAQEGCDTIRVTDGRFDFRYID